MADALYCNIMKCRTIISETAWVTKCFHLFCPEHGKSYFNNNLPEVNCPICNETNVKETDIALCELNPNDLILAGLNPEKAINIAMGSIKLRKQQILSEINNTLAQLEHLSKKLIQSRCTYEKTVKKLKSQHSTEIAALKSHYDEIAIKMNRMSQDLEIAKESKKKYQIAYNSMLLSSTNAEKLVIRPDNSTNHFFNSQYFDKKDPSPDERHSLSQSMLTSDNFLARHFNV